MAQAPGADEVGEIIAKCLPPHTRTIGPSDFVSTETHVFTGASTEQIRQAITTAWHTSQKTGSSSSYETSTVWLQDIASHSIVGEPLSVVHWNVSSVEISLQPIDTGNIFRTDGTYFLVGLSGQLGQSLCHWMVTHGARYVVLTSRNPKVHPSYVNMIEDMGATVKIMSM